MDHIGLELHVVDLLHAIALPVSGEIDNDDLEIFRQPGHHSFPDLRRFGETVEQDDRLSLAGRISKNPFAVVIEKGHLVLLW
jgi:hypothetical protein